jgi:hypothetical protein
MIPGIQQWTYLQHLLQAGDNSEHTGMEYYNNGHKHSFGNFFKSQVSPISID